MSQGSECIEAGGSAAGGATPFVSVRDLVKHYQIPGRHQGRCIKAVDGVSFTIREGQVLGLVGESGCGKSTIARLLVHLMPATGGSVTIDGREILGSGGEELRRFRRTVQL